jgi:hypothetical protein
MISDEQYDRLVCKAPSAEESVAVLPRSPLVGLELNLERDRPDF